MLYSLNIDNPSIFLAFKKDKRHLYRYYPKMVKGYKKQLTRLDIRQYLVLLSSFVRNMKHVWSIDKLLKNV